MTSLISIIVILCVCLAISLYYAIKFSLIILRVEDAIEESLDVIDERYKSISRVLEIPVFYDSPQIRQVVNDIKVTRDTLLLIANKFASIDETSIEQDNEVSDRKETNNA
jgi:hypothetical protein